MRHYIAKLGSNIHTDMSNSLPHHLTDRFVATMKASVCMSTKQSRHQIPYKMHHNMSTIKNYTTTKFAYNVPCIQFALPAPNHQRVTMALNPETNGDTQPMGRNMASRGASNDYEKCHPSNARCFVSHGPPLSLAPKNLSAQGCRNKPFKHTCTRNWEPKGTN